MSVEDTDMNAVIALLSDFEITGFSNRRESLEDYFMKFYKEDKGFRRCAVTNHNQTAPDTQGNNNAWAYQGLRRRARHIRCDMTVRRAR